MRGNRQDCPAWCVSLHRGEGPGQPYPELRHHAMYSGQGVQVDVLQADQQSPRVVVSAVEGLAHVELSPHEALTLSQALAKGAAKAVGRLPRPRGVTACPSWCEADVYGDDIGERPHGGDPHESERVIVSAVADHVPVELDAMLRGDAGGQFVEVLDSHWFWTLRLEVDEAAKLGHALLRLAGLDRQEGGS